MDGLSLFAVSHELSGLINGKIDKIQQPERDMLVMTIRAGGSNHKLLLSAHPENGRVQLTNRAFSNPAEAPAFCMLLRKHLTGGKIRAIAQPMLDRVLHIEVEARNELSDLVGYKIIVELMGKHSNLALVNDKGTLLDCIRHVGADMSSIRLMLPGRPYLPPPTQEKRNPLLASEDDFLAVLSSRGLAHKLLSGNFFGLSMDCARQMVLKWAGETELYCENLKEQERKAFAAYIYKVYQSFAGGLFEPSVVYNDAREPVAVYPFAPGISAVYHTRFSTISEALDTYYEGRDIAARFQKRSASLYRAVQNHLERCYKRLAVFEQALNSGEDLEQFRLYGELLLTGAHEVQRGQEYARLLNYYTDPPSYVSVPLDKRISPQENAQQYFKRYQKGKAAKELAVAQKEQVLKEIEYLEGQLSNLAHCTLDVELQEIAEELTRERYIKREKTKDTKQKTPLSKPMRFTSSDGLYIYVGRNNQQNDWLTLRFAQSEDWWLHTKDIPGSHVLVRCEGEMPNATLLEAAMLAAYHSKARASGSVPVDFCRRKHVKKMPGGRPGMVIYVNNRTVYITPDEVRVKQFMHDAIVE